MGLSGGAQVLRVGSAGKRVPAGHNGGLLVAAEGGGANVAPNVDLVNEQLPHAGLGTSFAPFSERVEKVKEAATAEASTPAETAKTKYVTGVVCTFLTKSGGNAIAKVQILMNGGEVFEDALAVIAGSKEAVSTIKLTGFPLWPLRKTDKLHVKVISASAEGTVSAAVFGCIVNQLESGGG